MSDVIPNLSPSLLKTANMFSAYLSKYSGEYGSLDSPDIMLIYSYYKYIQFSRYEFIFSH